MFDLLIKGGTVYDGLGGPGAQCDLGVKGEHIVALAPCLTGARTTVDARDKVVCPGFIDMHAHSGLVVFQQPDLTPKVRQGITTEAIGMDGISVAPVTSAGLSEREKYIAALDGRINQAWSWRTFPQYLEQLRLIKASTNLVPFIPHGAIHDVVMGLADRPATPDEIEQMCALLEEAFQYGAAGLSFGLIYLPGAYARPEEIAALVRVAGRYQRPITVHVRNEAEHIVESVREMADIAAAAKAILNISHLKIIGKQNKHLLPELLEVFEEYAEAGLALSFDQYPYNAGNTQLAVLIPPWAHDGGPEALIQRLESVSMRQQIRHDMEQGLPGWENLYRHCGWNCIYISAVASAKNGHTVGRSIDELAQANDIDPFDVVFGLLVEERLEVGMIDFYGDEEVMQTLMRSRFQTVGTDGIFHERGPHPRLYGTFPRILGRYVREKSVLSLAEAIKRMTSRPAQVLRIADRGVLAPGYKADMVVFDRDTIIDNATYRTPKRFPQGIEWVLVNGAVTVNSLGQIINRNGQLILSS